MTCAKPIVAVYRDTWLAPSEGFIIEPTTHFARYQAVAIGLGTTDSTHALMADTRTHLWGEPLTERSRARLRREGFGGGAWRLWLGDGVALVHAHFGPDALIARHIADDLDVPLVVTMHGYDITRRDRDFLRDAPGRSYLRHRRQLKRRAEVCLPVSEFLHDEMLRKGWPAQRTLTHHIGVDVDFWRPLPTQMQDVTSRDLLVVGRLINLKGVDSAIRAVMSLRQEFPDVRLHIVGDGPKRPALELLAAACAGSVIFHGTGSRVTIQALLRRCRAVVVPSRCVDGRREALNLVALEAASSGVPVVAFHSGGIGEVVRNGLTGFLVAEDDETALTCRIRQLLLDPDAAKQLGANGREMAVEEFSMRTQARKLEAIFDRAVSDRLVGTSHD